MFRFKAGRPSKSSLTVWVIVLAIAAVGLIDYIQRSQNSPLTKIVSPRSKGNLQAPLKIIEFADLQCHECAKGYQLLKDYMAQHPEDIFLTMKFYPLGELNSTRSALYAECAARQNKFWEFADDLFANQADWRLLLDAYSYFDSVARKIHLNMDELNACVKREDVGNLILSEKAVGESNFVKATPTFFIDKKMIVGAEELKKFLDNYFKSKESP